MTHRPPELLDFLDSVRAGFAALKTGHDVERCVGQVFALLDAGEGALDVGGKRLPACDSLAEALRTAGTLTPAIARIAAAFAALEPSLTWRHRSDGPQSSANFMQGHANAMVCGPGGMEDRADAWIGVSLLAPTVRYPDHRHAPEEVYLVLSPGEFRQEDGPWFEPGPGGTFYNKPDILHAMRSGQAPLLALWCLRPDPA